jgi:protein-tyrosine phosphatase
VIDKLPLIVEVRTSVLAFHASASGSNVLWRLSAMSDIFWIDGNPPPGLAVVTRPRGDDRLQEGLLRLKQGGIRTLVSLLPPHEADWLGMAEEPASAGKAGLEFLSYPIFDGYVPTDIALFRAFVDDLAERLRAGQHIGIHCRASVGRATIVAACTLIHLGWKPPAALAAVEEARGCPVPDTEEQRAWIMAYEARR